MLKYHSSIYAKPSELNTIYSHSMTLTSKEKNDPYDTILPKSTKQSSSSQAFYPSALFKVIVLSFLKWEQWGMFH